MRISDWSSDVCSSDLGASRRSRADAARADAAGERCHGPPAQRAERRAAARRGAAAPRLGPRPLRGLTRQDRKSVEEGESVSVSVDLGGRRFIKKKHRRTTKRRKREVKDRVRDW